MLPQHAANLRGKPKWFCAADVLLECWLGLRQELFIETRKHQRVQQKLRARRSTNDSLAGGGATPFAAQQRIDLIVTTIAPDSWKQNGGNGSISYYARNPAFVIRQTSEVHCELAELLRALRP